jgi:MFS family permease
MPPNWERSRADLGALTAASTGAVPAADTGDRLADTGAQRAAVDPDRLAAAGAGQPATPAVRDLAGLGLLQAIGGVGFGLSSPLLMGLSIRAVPSEERATAMGAFQAVYSIGMLAGPWSAGWLADVAGLGSVFIAAGLLALGSFAFVLLFAPRE